MNVNHNEPLGFGAVGQAASYVALHGTEAQLGLVVTAIQRRWRLLTVLGPLACEPEFGCHHLHLVVLGEFEPTNLHTIVADLGITAATMTAHLN